MKESDAGWWKFLEELARRIIPQVPAVASVARMVSGKVDREMETLPERKSALDEQSVP